MSALTALGDWGDLHFGDLVGLPPEPPVETIFRVCGGPHHGTVIASTPPLAGAVALVSSRPRCAAVMWSR
jgi:hypothetical protein